MNYEDESGNRIIYLIFEFCNVDLIKRIIDTGLYLDCPDSFGRYPSRLLGTNSKMFEYLCKAIVKQKIK